MNQDFTSMTKCLPKEYSFTRLGRHQYWACQSVTTYGHWYVLATDVLLLLPLRTQRGSVNTIVSFHL